MAKRLSRGKVLVGNLKTSAGGFLTQILTATVARTDTAAKNLFLLPAAAVIQAIHIFSPAASNASLTATLSVGKTGNNTFFVNALDVKAATGAGQQVPVATNLGALNASTQIVGIYAETGTASTTGGPWTVIVFFTMAP